jgi:ubiquinone/menaquinone biosynthesis C-methylase UbiE
MSDRSRSRRMARGAVVWDPLIDRLDQLVAKTGRRSGLDVVDAGGGTGGFAVPLAELGHTVTVVDPSPDALAALERRVAEAGVGDRVIGLQGELAALPGLIGAERVDAVLCHGVLEYVEDPETALGAVAKCLRPGGLVSVIVANKTAAVLARAIAGRFTEARHALDDPVGRFSDLDPMPRRYTIDSISEVMTGAGLTVTAVHGVQVFTDLVPAALVEGEPRAQEQLRQLEIAASTHPTLRAVAGRLHLLATRS